MEDTIREIALCGILPCLRAETVAEARAALEALANKGFPAVEVECPQHANCDWETLFHHGDIAVGAWVNDPAQARAALTAGAAWVTLESAVYEEQADFPGVMPDRPNALEADMGNPLALCVNAARAEAMLAAHPEARLWVSECEDARDCRRWLPRVAAIRMPVRAEEAPAERLKGLWAETLGFSLAHIGINSADATAAGGTAKLFSALLGMPYLPGDASDYAGTIIEAMKEPGRGTHGHIGIMTDDLERGMYFAKRAGFAFDPASRKNDADGNAVLYYLDREIAGFAVHLLQRPGRIEQ